MIKIIYINKDSWPDGPWKNEIDTQFWKHKSGFYCLIHRHPWMGHLCGYIGSKRRRDVWKRNKVGRCDELVIHGGITFGPGDLNILPKIMDNIWWIGFDCAHNGDIMPYSVTYSVNRKYTEHDAYKNISFVKKQIYGLIRQLKK